LRQPCGVRPVVLLIDIYSFVIFGSVILSWIRLPDDNPIVRVIRALTEPVLGPVRRLLPDAGGLDFSAMIVLILLRLLRDQLLR
jgi:YggT family protein